MTALLVHVCAACDAPSQPSEAEPNGWQRFGDRLLCSRCTALRRTGLSGSPMISDRAFVERLGMTTVPERETPKPQALCAGCKEAFPAGSGSEFCVACRSKRANPRAYRPTELEEAGLDPAVVLGDWGKPNRAS
jgi:hypothetical protein